MSDQSSLPTGPWHRETARTIAGLTGVVCEERLAKLLVSEASYLSPSDRDDFAQWLVLECLEMMERGEVSTAEDVERLVHRIRQRIFRRVRREVPLELATDQSVAREERPRLLTAEILRTFTAQETLLITLLIEGQSVKEIAARCGVSERSVYRAFERIKSRLQS